MNKKSLGEDIRRAIAHLFRDWWPLWLGFTVAMMVGAYLNWETDQAPYFIAAWALIVVAVVCEAVVTLRLKRKRRNND